MSIFKVKVRDRTVYADTRLTALDRTRNEDRYELACHLRDIRRNLDCIILREAPGCYFITNVRGSMRFERILEIERRAQAGDNCDDEHISRTGAL